MTQYLDAYVETRWTGAGWVGRVTIGKRALDLVLPLPASISQAYAEASTVYEAAGSIPLLVGGSDLLITLHLKEQVAVDIVNTDPRINQRMGAIAYVAIVDPPQGADTSTSARED